MAHVYGGQVPLRTRRALALIAGILAVATAIGMVVLRPTGEDRPDLSQLGFVSEVLDARVAEAKDVPCQEPAETDVRCRLITYELLEGPDEGRRAEQEFLVSGSTPRLEAGDEVVLTRVPEAEPEFRYRFIDRRRTSGLLWLGVAFALAVVVLGRLRGAAALAGLAASLVVVIQFVLPSVLDGRSPVMVAVVGASAIAFLALYLSHGFTSMTTVALLGTLASLGLTAILANVFVGVTELTGLASEEATVVQVGSGTIDLRGILLGGVVIGALGAIDDMTVTQASAVWELRAANRTMSAGSLFRSAMRIGQNHVASTVNTLALAYAGAAMPVLLLFVLSRQSIGTVVNGEVIATELVRTLVGSIGLVTAVPITTWLAARSAPPADAQGEVTLRTSGAGRRPRPG